MKQPHFLRALLFTEDMCEVRGSVLRSDCYVVQNYEYHCFRCRDEKGNTYGSVRSGYLEFTISADAERGTKRFYQRMKEHDNAAFSFIFNASFGTNDRLSGFDDGMVAYGYVVDIEEQCHDNDDNRPEQLLLHIKLLLSNINYVGRTSLYKLIINND